MSHLNQFSRPSQVATLIALTLGTVAASQAQTTATPQLKEVLVSGTRSVRFTDDLPLSTDVIDVQAMEASQVGDILDVAKKLPNVSVKRAPARFGVTGSGNAVGVDGNAGFSIRGQGGNRVLMLVDGVRQPRAYANGSTAFGRDSVALGLVKQLEIVRGPSSALYGSDGLAGLVNFITVEPQDLLSNASGVDKTLGGKAWLAHSGDDEGTTAGITLAGRLNATTQWLLSASKSSSFGMSNMGENDAANVDRTTPNPQTIVGDGFLGKLVFQPNTNVKQTLTFEQVNSGSDVELLSRRVKVPVAMPLTYPGPTQVLKDMQILVAASKAIVDENASKSSTRNRLSWDGAYKMKAAYADTLKASLSWQESMAHEDGQTTLKTLWPNDGIRTRQTSYQERGWQASVQADKALVMSPQWSQLISYGADYSAIDVSSLTNGFDPAPLAAFTSRHYFPDTRDTHQALFVQSEWVGGNWSVTPGVRFDQFAIDVLSQSGYYPNLSTTPAQSLSGTATSPKLAVLYRATPQWSVYGNVASGFRAPEGQQVNSALELLNVKLLPNPNLKPEESRNFELGFKARMDGMSLDAAVFTSRYTNLIQEKKDMGTANGLPASITNPTLFQTVNIDKASISGFEVKGHADLGRLASGKLAASLTYGQTHGTNDSTGLPLNYLEPAKLTLGLAYTSAAWDVSLTVNHHAAKNVDELDSPYIPKSTTQLQFTVPESTTLDLQSQWRIRKNLRLNLGVVNLTDQKYWNWSDVQGLASNPTAPLLPVVDAYTQPGRHINVSMVMDF
jgi:hemoglobin/transferrin/lactoferrin receptor protein